LINYLCVAGEKSLLEHINSFSEAITNPVQVHDGHFVTPWESGYSVEYRPEAISRYEYPTGEFWTSQQGLDIRRSPRN
jgi:L-galactonate dehydratase